MGLKRGWQLKCNVVNMYVLNKDDNIVSLATPIGVGALAVVRISGRSLSKLFYLFTKKNPKNRLATYTNIYHPSTDVLLDKSIITYFQAPESFTGEDVIEISCHGGPFVSRTIISAAIDLGARQSDPGEFSYRAFLNGKIDLIEAEAIDLLISSTSNLSANLALEHLQGNVRNNLNEIQQFAIDLLSIIENELNFSEEELKSTSYSKISYYVGKIKKYIELILDSTLYGKELISGIRIAIIGRPNSGKSSLFNALIGINKAIVSDIPGTTRDAIEANFEINGVSVCLIDTAGIWESEDFLDAKGVQKSMEVLDSANYCIVLDETSPSDLLKSKLFSNYAGQTILVQSKVDKNIIEQNSDVFYTSSLKIKGLDRLLTYISTLVDKDIDKISSMDCVLINKRQSSCLEAGLNSINLISIQLADGLEMDIVASTLRNFINILSDMIGDISDESIINNIFNSFCVGK